VEVVDNKLEKELQKLLEVEAVQVEEVDMLGIHMQDKGNAEACNNFVHHPSHPHFLLPSCHNLVF
jgi:hypothetical protein